MDEFLRPVQFSAVFFYQESCQLKLTKIGIPVAAIWLRENEPQFYGTRYLKRLLSNIEQEEVDSAIKLDVMREIESS